MNITVIIICHELVFQRVSAYQPDFPNLVGLFAQANHNLAAACIFLFSDCGYRGLRCVGAVGEDHGVRVEHLF